jgi:hypothetical protein
MIPPSHCYLKKLDDVKELQRCINAFWDYKAVLALRFTLRAKVSY